MKIKNEPKDIGKKNDIYFEMHDSFRFIKIFERKFSKISKTAQPCKTV